MFMLFKKKEKFEYNLDPQMADKMLQNVFESVGQRPNTIPFDRIALKKGYKKGSLLTAYIATILAIALTVISPFHFAQISKRLNTSPSVESTYVQNSMLWIVINEPADTVDYSQCYAKSNDGSIIYPAVTDAKEGLVAFDTIESSLNIYITNYAGKVTHAVYTEK